LFRRLYFGRYSHNSPFLSGARSQGVLGREPLLKGTICFAEG
jgi:hypothetical protein